MDLTTFMLLNDELPSRVGARRSGRVRASGRTVIDDTGAFFPLGASLFWAPWGWRNDRARTEQHLAWLRDHGFDFFRVFGEVGGRSWEDRIIDPRDPGYESTMGNLFDTAWNVYGRRIGLTVFAGGTGADPNLVIDKITNVLRGREHMIQHIEGANEAFQNFPNRAQLRSLVQTLRSRFPGLLIGTSSPNAEMTATTVDADITNFFFQHSDRGRGDNDWRQPRQPWDVKDLRTPGCNDEPPGPQSSVEVLTDPLRLAMLRVMGVLCGEPGFVLHAGPGVRGGGAADLARTPPRSRNLWDVPNIEAIVAALRNAVLHVPADLPNWQKTNGRWADHPMPADQYWPDEGKGDHGIVRTYGAYSGGTFVTLAFGIKNFVILTPRRAGRVQVYHPTTGDLVIEQDLNAGEGLRLTQAQGEAVIIVGTR